MRIRTRGCLLSQLESGLWYVNVTSAGHLDGQVRGQILPVPEPSVLALLGSGAVCFLLKPFDSQSLIECLDDALDRPGGNITSD